MCKRGSGKLGLASVTSEYVGRCRRKEIVASVRTLCEQGDPVQAIGVTGIAVGAGGMELCEMLSNLVSIPRGIDNCGAGRDYCDAIVTCASMSIGDDGSRPTYPTGLDMQAGKRAA